VVTVVNNTNNEDHLTNLIKEIDWLEIQKLGDSHDTSKFCCGESKNHKDLDAFIKEDAFNQQKQNINVTYVAVAKGSSEVIGFVTILNDRLRVSNAEKGDMKITAKYSDFPATKIGRLAVDKKHKNKKVATNMLRFVMGLALESADKIGCRFLIVDSYPESADFYLRKGYVKNQVQDQTRTKFLEKKPDGSKDIVDKTHRETISLRYDLLNLK